jgi:hypothetical protein
MESIHELRTEHLEEAVRFIGPQIAAAREVKVVVEEILPRYRWMYVDNPRRRDDFIGWGLRTGSGELVGTHLIAWQHYRRGDAEARALVSTNSYVAEGFRGPRGLGLMLNMTRRADADLCMCTTANVMSGSVWKSMRGIEMAGGGWEFLVPVNWTAWGVGGLIRHTRSPLLKRLIDQAGRLLPPVRRRLGSSSGYKVEELRKDEVTGAGVAPLTGKWEPLRDPVWLQWRYADNPSNSIKLLRVTRSAAGGDLFVGVRIAPRGFGRGLRQMMILDVHGSLEAEPEAVLAALLSHFSGRVDLICIRLLAAMLWENRLALIARRRTLEFPTHWMLSRKMTLLQDDWRPSHGDGDVGM